MKKINVVRSLGELGEEGETRTYTKCAETDLGIIYYCEETFEYFLESDVIVDLEM